MYTVNLRLGAKYIGLLSDINILVSQWWWFGENNRLLQYLTFRNVKHENHMFLNKSPYTSCYLGEQSHAK